MSFFKKLFASKESHKEPQKPTLEQRYAEFWQWFQLHQQDFHKIIDEMNRETIEENFFDKISPELAKVHDGIFFLAGMWDAQTAELILTPDGVIRNIVFVEELVAAAPEIAGWRFTAMKPETDISNISIRMHDYEFDKETLSFYLKDDADYPDDIDLVVVHDQYDEAKKSEILQGVYIFLDNYLGEYVAVTKLDNVEVQGTRDATKDLIPIEQLKNLLILKNSEISRLDKVIHTDSDDDEYVGLEGETEQGLPLVASLNSTLLSWDQKASHPWMMIFDIHYDGKNSNGMPSSEDYQLLEQIEQEIMEQLTDFSGYLNIGRETGNGLRTVYFACKELKKPAKVIDQVVEKYQNTFEIEVSLFKDKYWRCLNKFSG